MRVQEDSAAPKVPSVPAVLSDLPALRALKVPKDRRVPSVLRGFPERQVQPERRDLRVYKESPDRRAHLSQVIFYFILMVTGDRSPSDLVKI